MYVERGVEAARLHCAAPNPYAEPCLRTGFLTAWPNVYRASFPLALISDCAQQREA